MNNNLSDIVTNLISTGELDEELVLSINNSDLFCNIAICYENQKKYNKCKKYFKLSLTANPKNTDALLCFGNHYLLNNKNPEKCLKYYQMAREINPKDPMPVYNIGVYFNQIKKDSDSAMTHYLEAAKLGYNVAMCGVANVYASQNKFDLAEQYWTQAAKLENCDSIRNLVKYYDKNKVNDELKIKYCLQLIEKHTNNLSNDVTNPIINTVAEYYKKKDNMLLAEKYYLMLISRNYSTQSIASELIICFAKLNYIEKASKYFNMITISDYYYYSNNEDAILVSYLSCINNKATVQVLIKFFNYMNTRINEQTIKNHRTKIMTISSHFNYLITSKLDVGVNLENGFKDVVII